MHLSTFTDYTLRVLIYLALEPGRRVTVPEMASAYGVSENHLMKVVHRLARSGTIESVRGKGGGVRLARDPAAIRLGHVIRASEGETAIIECLSGAANSCRIAPVCRLTNIVGNAFEDLYRSLDTYTVADLCGNGGELRALLPTRR